MSMTIDRRQQRHSKMGGVQTLHIILVISFCLAATVLAIVSSTETIPTVEYGTTEISLASTSNLESATTEISSATETTPNLESATTVSLGIPTEVSTLPCAAINNPCQNGGTCVDTWEGFQCVCGENYSGTYCEKVRNHCLINRPCQNGGSCENANGGYRCSCDAGYSGINCEEYHGVCKIKNPCQNNGKCEDKRVPANKQIKSNKLKYECKCEENFEGTNCESYMGDACSSNPCKNGALCQNINGGYNCKCDFGYSGLNCENYHGVCMTKNFCKNKGRCIDTWRPELKQMNMNINFPKYECICEDNYEGTNCENYMGDACSTNPCENQGDCQNTRGGYKCRCKDGYSGTNCELYHGVCKPNNPCLNNGKCADKERVGFELMNITLPKYECTCQKNFEGTNCERYNGEYCSVQNPCKNYGKCLNTEGGYECSCPPGYSGTNCEDYVGTCSVNYPCQNGICVHNLDGGYKCICDENFIGVHCEKRACAPGWIHFSNGCYKHFPNGKSWKDARCSCKSSAPDNDGDLASVPNQETNDFLSKLSTGNFWIGGYRNTFNKWSWSDGTPWTFESWSKGQPDDNRGYEDYVGFVDWNGEKGKWNDFSCEGRDGLSYMCHYPVKDIIPASFVAPGQVATVPTWGPSYSVSLKLYVNSFDSPNLLNGEWAELLRFTTSENDCCSIGDRIPAIFTNKRGTIHVTTQVGNDGNLWRPVPLEPKTWYLVEMNQHMIKNKYYFEIKLDGRVVEQVENENPLEFEDVKVWAAQAHHGYPAADAVIGDLMIAKESFKGHNNNVCVRENRYGLPFC